MKRLILFIMSTGLYKYLLKHVIPYIRFTTYYTSLRGEKYHRGYAKLRPGHIILTNDKKKLTGLLIPGDWSHAALCVSKGPKYSLCSRIGTIDAKVSFPFEVVEMTHTDFTKSHFFDICKEADRVCILECLDWDEHYIKKVIAAALSFEGAKYDSDFSLGIEALYCSELIYQADVLANYPMPTERPIAKKWDVKPRLDVDLSDLAGLGRPYLSPDGLYRARNCRVVWDSDNQ